MEAKELRSDSLNEQQLLMLRLLKTPMSEASFTQIRQLAVKLLAVQMNENITEWENENGITEEYYEKAINQHYRSSKK